MIDTQKFHTSLLWACDMLGRQAVMATRICNKFRDSEESDLGSLTDAELMDIDGIGDASICIIRLAWPIYQAMMQDDAEESRDTYITGGDLVKWIYKHGLFDKVLEYSGFGKLGFRMRPSKSVDGFTYYVCGDLNLLTGHLVEYEDSVE